MSIRNNNQPVASNVIRIIDRRGLKKKVIAEKAGYSEQMLSDMLNGRRVIKIIDVKKLGKALGVDANALFATDSRTACVDDEAGGR